MRDADDVVKELEPPHELIELLLWTTYNNIKQLYLTGQVERSKATTMRLKAYREYEQKLYEWEQYKKLYKEFTENILKTDSLRCKLNKECTLDTALELIGVYSGQEKHYEKMRREQNVVSDK